MDSMQLDPQTRFPTWAIKMDSMHLDPQTRFPTWAIKMHNHAIKPLKFGLKSGMQIEMPCI